jgi:ankyrin repeat protein
MYEYKPRIVVTLTFASSQIEKVWTLDLSATACKTVFADLVRIMDDYNSKSDVSSAKSEAYDELKEAAAKAAYQLHLAHLIGMGCDVSNETAIDQLLLSARLGHEDAQKEAFGTIAALKHEMSRPERDDVIQWLTQAAINGDMACLQELRALDQGAYQAVATSEAHRKAMCERSGFIFDDDFVECNDVGDVPGLIAAIMDSGEPIDSDIGGGLTWLHYAIFSGSLELATKLVDEFKLPLDARNSKGQTPLWIACLSGNFEMSAFLLSRGADASIASNSGNNPLHHLVAFEEEYIESMAQNLQAQGADVNGRNAVGMTPLHYAIRGSGNLEEEAAVAALLQLGADPLIRDDEDETPLAAAIYTMRPFYLKRLLEYAPLSTMPGAELHNILASAFRGWIWSMKHHRLRSGSLLYTDRIAHLVRFFHTDEVHDAFTASDPAGFTPLHAACASCADDIASEIIKLPNARLGLDAGEYGYTPIMIAIRKSTWPLIEKLIDAGADLLATARTGENVIHHVVQYRPGLLPYVCDQIEKRRADLASMCNQATAWKGETPLDYALSLGRPEAAHFLIGKGADPNALRESKENAGLWLNSLRFCLVPPSVRMLELLLPYLEPGSFVCAGNGMNLLHLACIHVPDGACPIARYVG